MNKNEFDVFEDPNDEILNEIAVNYPILTDEEKDRMFSMSERKYNITNNMNSSETGDEVSGVERYTGRIWHRYAAVAAAFVLLAGGVGGSIALGKHMDKNKKTESKVQVATTTSVTTEAVQTTSPIIDDDNNIVVPGTGTVTALTTTVTDVTTDTTTTAVDERRHPTDLDEFAEEWKDKYEKYLWNIYCGAVKHEENTVSFNMAEGSVVDKVDAWKVTDETYSSADAINEFLSSVWAPGTNDKLDIPDLTDKIENKTAVQNDFTQSLFFIYKNELYVVAAGKGLEGTRTDLRAEQLNDNEMLVHWLAGYAGEGEQQSLHLVWVDELNDWRIDDLVSGSKYFGMPSQAEAEAVAKELLNGYKDVYNAKYGIGVKYDENDKISFGIHTDDASDGEWYVYYVKVTDSRFSNTDDIKTFLCSRFEEGSTFMHNTVGGDLSKYKEGTSFNINSEYTEGSDNAYINLTNYIMYNGSLYLRYDCFNSEFYGVDNVKNSNNMENDPEIESVKVDNGNMISIVTTGGTSGNHTYWVQRDDSGEWRVFNN